MSLARQISSLSFFIFLIFFLVWIIHARAEVRFPAAGIALWVELIPLWDRRMDSGFSASPGLFAVTAKTFPNPKLGRVSNFF